MTSYATVDEVGKLYGPLTDAEREKVADLIARASSMLAGHVPDMQARLDSGELDPVLASTAVVSIVLRAMRPRGLIAETVGPFRREFNRDGATDWLTVSQQEIDLVSKQAAPGRPAGGTIRLRPGFGHSHHGWPGVRRW